MVSESPKPTYEELLATIEEMRRENAALKANVSQLRDELAAAKKNSRNSSTPHPPISSNPKNKDTANRKKRRKRKIGGQPGHKKHERVFDLSEADQLHDHTLDECPHGGAAPLIAFPAEPKILYQYELVEKPVLLHAHLACAYWCEDCDEIHYGKIPPAIRKGGLAGNRLTALIGCLKGGCHASYSTTQAVLSHSLVVF